MKTRPGGTGNGGSDSAEPSYEFFFGPFRFLSEIDIPELRATSGSGKLTATIRKGGVPDAIDGGQRYGESCLVSAKEYLLRIPGTARFYVREGREVRLEVEPGVGPADVSTFLLGSVFGVLCHQNGLLPLHASAVKHGGAVTAFLGDSGAGKSTLAACLARRGLQVAADDICLLEPTVEGARVIPVAGWLKLWRQSWEHLEATPDEEHRVFSRDDKFRMYLDGSAEGRLPLRRVVFLKRSSAEAGAAPRLTELGAAQAIASLMAQTYAGYAAELAGLEKRLFRDCATALRAAQALELQVPWGLDRMDDVLKLLERELF